MSSQYDDWRTETDLDYYERMGVHRRGGSSLPPAEGGRCACGAHTTRSFAGYGWQCVDCSEAAMRALYEKRTRRA